MQRRVLVLTLCALVLQAVTDDVHQCILPQRARLRRFFAADLDDRHSQIMGTHKRPLLQPDTWVKHGIKHIREQHS